MNSLVERLPGYSDKLRSSRLIIAGAAQSFCNQQLLYLTQARQHLDVGK